jgi:hypothetical protein
MNGEKAVIKSKVRIEKFNENMELEDIHESDAPNSEEPNKQVPEKEIPVNKKS